MTGPLTTRFCAEKKIHYDGTQLAPHWIYRELGVLGDAVVAFRGGADVTLDHMVDLEDVRRKAPIHSPLMLHFLGEWFSDSFEVGILLQHLFLCQAYEIFLEDGVKDLRRRGNDIYFREKKLSVSIATKSTISVLMHAGFNIDTEGTPIPTAGLKEMGVDPIGFAEKLLARFNAESQIWRIARLKTASR